MRVATFYENRLGRNDGPPLFWWNAMKDEGIEVVHLSSKNLPSKTDKYDAYLWVDWGEDGLTNMLPYKPISMESLHPSIYVTSDTHLGYEYRMNKAKEFDKVYCNQLRAVSEFAEDGVKSEWLPHAVEPKAYPDKPICIKKYDIGFVGYVGFLKRAEMLDEMFKAFPNFWYGQRFSNYIYGGNGEDTAEIYRKSRIVFNTSAVDDINMRFFEGWAAGAFTLSEWVPSFDEMELPGIPGKIFYNDIKEAVITAKYYIDNPEEREEICLIMKEWILKYHTYGERVKSVLIKEKKDG